MADRGAITFGDRVAGDHVPARCPECGGTPDHPEIIVDDGGICDGRGLDGDTCNNRFHGW